MSPYGSGGLDDHLKDVPASSPDDIQDDELELEEDELEAEGSGKDTADDDDQDANDNEKKSGRSIENVYRELARKQDEFQERMQRNYAESMRALIAELRSTSPAQPAKQDGNQLDNSSIEDLQAIRPNIPAENRDAFDDYLTKRIIREETDKFKQQFTQSQEFEMTRRDATRLATQRFKELTDRNSEFYRLVDAELRARGVEYAKTNPRAVLDVANEIAWATGRPASNPTVDWRGQTRAAPVPATRRNSRPVENKSEDTLSDEKALAIKERLEASIPGLKIDIKRVKENHRIYSENKDLFVN